MYEEQDGRAMLAPTITYIFGDAIHYAITYTLSCDYIRLWQIAV